MNIKRLDKKNVICFTKFLHNAISDYNEFPALGRQLFIKKWNSNYIRDKLCDHLMLYCSYQDEIHGILIGTPPEGGVATIFWVLVKGEMRNRGIGVSLIEKSIEFFQLNCVHKIKVTVCEPNLIRFYNKFGFVVEGKHPNHWWGKTFYSLGLNL